MQNGCVGLLPSSYKIAPESKQIREQVIIDSFCQIGGLVATRYTTGIHRRCQERGVLLMMTTHLTHR